jgi:hypothetical protein
VSIRYSIHARSTVACLCLAITAAARPQDPEDMLTRYRRAYHDANGVYIKLNTTITIHHAGNALVAERDVEQERISLRTSSGEADLDQVGYTGMLPLKHIEAWTLTPLKTSYRKVEVSDFSHRDERTGHIFHDDSRTVNFRFPLVKPGAITHLDYVLEFPDARFINGHFFSLSDPVEESTLRIVYDDDIDVRAVPFHIPEGMLESTRTTRHGKVERTFVMRRVPPTITEAHAPSFRHFAPHMQLVVHGPEQDPSLSDLDRLYRWYHEHIAGLSTRNGTEMDSVSEAVISDAHTAREKAQRLFAWVQDHITYVAVEDGMNGFVPAQASDVCAARYGDCKGMASLLRTLLLNVGLDAHLAWVGSRDLPYSYSELPASGTDDHMIVVLALDSAYIFLDPTSEQCPFGQPSYYIQDKEVLMSIDSTRYKVLRVPVIPAEENRGRDSVHMHAEGTDLVGAGVLELTGQLRAEMVNMLNRLPPERWSSILRSRRMKYNNRYEPGNIRVEGLEDRNGPLILRYDFRIPGAVVASGQERFVPLDLDFPWREDHYLEGRSTPVQVDFRKLEEFITVLDSLPGTMAVALPTDTRQDHERFGCSCTYSKLANGDLACSTTYRTDHILLPVEDLKTWQAMLGNREREIKRSALITVGP